MPEVSLPWGKQTLKVSLPANWTVEQVAAPSLKPAEADWPDRIAMALGQPGTGLPLEKLLVARRSGRIVLVLEDMTRHSPLGQILPIILREIRHAKIEDEQVEVVFATGMHPPMTARQAGEKLGPECRHLRWRCNPCRDGEAHVSVGQVGKLDVRIDRGVAGADLRIIISSVSPHLQAGFGGGFKMLLPGCASLETVRGLHRLGVARTPVQLVGTEAARNPMRLALDAAGGLIDEAHGKSFALQYLLDADDLPTAVAAGEVMPTQQMLTKQCSVSCGVLVDSSADVLITNAHPRDFDLWQSFKSVANTQWAARRRGVIICFTRCLQGLNGVNPPRWPISARWTRRLVSWLGPEALGQLAMRLIPRLSGDAAFFVRLATHTLHRNPVLIVSPHLKETAAQFPGLDIFADADEAIAAAVAMLGPQPQRVIVFPSGGITFPIPAAGGRRT